jgi:hypothetical protein
MAEADPSPPRRERNWDAYAAVVASFIGLLALLVSGYTAYVQDRQARAQVWPRLELSRYGVRHSLVAENRGVGPARVKAVKVVVDGKPVRRWVEMLRAMGRRGPFVYSQSQISGRVLSPGQDVDIFAAADAEDSRKMFADVTSSLFNEEALHKVGILVCYCSVFDQCWLAGLGNENLAGTVIDDERPVGRCPIPENDRFRE